jgi:hypothetical protein
MKRHDWGDGAARFFLGAIAVALLAGAAFSQRLGFSPLTTGALVALGAVFAVLCGFYRSIEGELESDRFKVRFRSPPRPGDD